MSPLKVFNLESVLFLMIFIPRKTLLYKHDDMIGRYREPWIVKCMKAVSILYRAGVYMTCLLLASWQACNVRVRKSFKKLFFPC